MEYCFKSSKMKRLYTDKTMPTPRILTEDIVVNYVLTVNAVEKAAKIGDISHVKSWDFEYIGGVRKKNAAIVDGEYSMRLTKKWRLHMYILWTDPPACSVGKFTFLCISNHYSKTERWP
ncbi:MAG: hypothetical protein ACYDH4_05390 [Candidatus Cryosericum sp.]